MNNLTKNLIFLILLIIFTTGGFFLGKISNQAQLNEYDALKQNINTFFPQPPKEVFNTGGVIKNISNKQITIEINSFPKSNYPWDQQQELTREERIVTISKNTKLIKTTLDPFAQPEFTEEGLPKELQEENFQLSDLKAGDYIQISSIENIKTNKQLTAKDITIQTVVEYTPEEIGFPGLDQVEDLNIPELP